jgi:hypothetical protein
MARLRFIARQVNIATGTSAKTLMQIVAPTNQRVILIEFGISFRGTSATDPPVLVELLRQTTAGTMTSLTLVKADQSIAETIQSTAQHTSTGEPTAGDVYKSFNVHPQRGIIWQPGPLDQLMIPGGNRLGLRCTVGTTQNADVYMLCEE